MNKNVVLSLLSFLLAFISSSEAYVAQKDVKIFSYQPTNIWEQEDKFLSDLLSYAQQFAEYHSDNYFADFQISANTVPKNGIDASSETYARVYIDGQTVVAGTITIGRLHFIDKVMQYKYYNEDYDNDDAIDTTPDAFLLITKNPNLVFHNVKVGDNVNKVIEWLKLTSKRKANIIKTQGRHIRITPDNGQKKLYGVEKPIYIDILCGENNCIAQLVFFSGMTIEKVKKLKLDKIYNVTKIQQMYELINSEANKMGMRSLFFKQL